MTRPTTGTGPDGRPLPEQRDYQPAKVVLDRKPLARFWADANGIVYRYEFDDSVYKKDARVYPPSRSEDE